MCVTECVCTQHLERNGVYTLRCTSLFPLNDMSWRWFPFSTHRPALFLMAAEGSTAWMGHHIYLLTSPGAQPSWRQWLWLMALCSILSAYTVPFKILFLFVYLLNKYLSINYAPGSIQQAVWVTEGSEIQPLLSGGAESGVTVAM